MARTALKTFKQSCLQLKDKCNFNKAYLPQKLTPYSVTHRIVIAVNSLNIASNQTLVRNCFVTVSHYFFLFVFTHLYFKKADTLTEPKCRGRLTSFEIALIKIENSKFIMQMCSKR